MVSTDHAATSPATRSALQRCNVCLWLVTKLGLILLAGSGALRAGDLHMPSAGYYVGTIGERLKVQMNLARDRDEQQVSGSYYYEHVGRPLKLTGQLDSTGRLTLRERDERQRVTGTFRGTFVGGGLKFSGLWSSADGRRQLQCRLRQVAQFDVLELRHGDRVEASCRVPQLMGDADGLSQVNLGLRSAACKSTLEFVDGARSLFRDLSAETPHRYERRLHHSIAYYSPTFLSVLVSDWQYTGGAHGNVEFRSRNLAIRNGRLVAVSWQDLFRDADNAERRISDYCLADLKRQQAEWVVDGSIQQFPRGSLVLTASPRGLQAMFAPYAVGPYSSGVHEVLIPYRELRGVLRPEGPLGRMAAAAGVARGRGTESR